MLPELALDSARIAAGQERAVILRPMRDPRARADEARHRLIAPISVAERLELRIRERRR
jgi:hypothetical protein